jgi:1-phosphofructokinase
VTLNPAIDRTLTIPGFQAGKVNRAAAIQDTPGGKGVNVASILAGLKTPVAVTGFLGKENAALFDALFARKPIADVFIRIEGSTRVGIKIADPLQHQTTDINLPGLSVSATDCEKLIARVEELAKTHDAWFVFSGSLPPGLPPETYRDLIARVKRHGRKTALDCVGDAFARGLEASPDLVKPNLHELETWFGAPLINDTDILAAAKKLVKHGARIAAISMGEQGAFLVTQHSATRARPPVLLIDNTVGAGDAMVAGLLTAQLRGLSLAETARCATAFSLCHLTRAPSTPLTESALRERMNTVLIRD